MIDFKSPYTPQGDLNIFVCDEIPEDVEKKESCSESDFVLAHSETGHNHVISSEYCEYYEENDFSGYLDVKEASNVVHLRGFDTHETVKLPPGKYRITRQREYTPEGFRRAAD